MRSAIASSSRALRQTTSVRRRLYSTQESPSPKIVCVPFAQKPENVISKLNSYGLIASSRWYNIIYAGLLRIFGDGIAPFAKEFGMGENFKMRDVKAAYYPVWRVDAMLDGVVNGDEESRAWISVKEGYVPGNAFAPLSLMSFAVPPLPDDLPTFDPLKDLRQLGEGYDIIPVPFTTSPLSLIKTLRQVIGRRTEWEGYRVDETKWKETMVACYPIMFPIYIAEFEDSGGDKTRRFNVILDAHDSNLAMCRVTFSPPPWIRSEGRMDKTFFANPGPFLPITQVGLPTPPPGTHGESSNGITIVQETAKTDTRLVTALVEAYETFISPPPTIPSDVDIIPPSPLASIEDEINWSDDRIQSWNSVEREENGEYIDQGSVIRKTIEALERTSKIDEAMDEDTSVKTISMSPTKGFQVGNKLLSEIRAERSERLIELKKELEDLKPALLGVYEKEKKK